MNSNKIVRIVSAMMIAVLLVMIFLMSAQNGSESENASGSVVDAILSSSNGYNKLDEDKKTQSAEKLGFAIRKLAHFGEFFVLSVCLSVFLITYGKKKLTIVLISVAISSLYGITDELHQYFVPGRACLFTDMLIDTAGAVTGAFFMLLLYCIYIKRSKRIKNRKAEHSLI